MDDFESFEFIDYTTSGPWEKFIIQIEDCLKKWGLVHNSYGIFDPSPHVHATAVDNDDLADALADHTFAPEATTGTDSNKDKKELPETSSPPEHELYHRKEIVSLEDASYLLSYQYHPAKARIMAGVQGVDLDFLPTTLEGIQHHLLHRWTALTHILVLTPISATTSDTIVDLGSAKLLLSSFAIAFQNTGCNIPVFVPTGQPRTMTFTGLSIRPQLGVTKDDLGLDETEEDQAIEVRFNTVLVPYPPTQYTNLAGILDLFIVRMGLEDEFADQSGSSYHGANSHGGTKVDRDPNHAIKDQIFVSAYFSYPLDKWYDEGWKRPKMEKVLLPSLAQSSLSTVQGVGPQVSFHALPFGPVQDPLKSLQLVARFDMDASQANIWTLSATFKNDDYGILSGMLEDAIASWNMETSSTASGKSAGRNDEQGSEKSGGSSYGSLLRKGARLIQGTVAMVDMDDVNSIVEALFQTRPLVAATTASADSSNASKNQTMSSKSNRLIPAKELSLHFRHATVVPCGSLLYKMQQYLVDVISPESDITYPTTFMGFLKAVWAQVLDELQRHWELKKLIPLIDVFGKVDSEGLIQAKDCLKKSERHAQPAIDLRFNLLHQKLSMLNCCIDRELYLASVAESTKTSTKDKKESLAATEVTGHAPQTSSPSSSSVLGDNASSTLPPPSKTNSSPDSETDVEQASSETDEVSGDQLVDNLTDMKVSDAVDSTIEHKNHLESSPGSEIRKAEGALEQLRDLTLLETTAPLMIPKLQEPGFMTEDMIQEQEDLFENLGSSIGAAKIRTELQSAQLLSDMEAFKAANPGCVLGDFVRWHSPKDWDEDQQQMSTRMQEANNFWQELWTKSEPVPAHRQRPLFDHQQEAEKVLLYLKKLSGSQLFSQLLPTAFLLAYDALVSHPIASVIEPVTESLKSLAQELTDFPWDELSCAELDTNTTNTASSETSQPPRLAALDLKPILSKFRQVELLMGRALS
ncbi:Rab3 GTPase-activating protein catalytic subunit, partial [Podila epigama]